MAVIRCPNCHKPNPDFLSECQYCDAPLNAQGISPQAAEVTFEPEPSAWEPPASTEGLKNEPDWLWGGANEAQPAAAEPAMPDWLGGASATPAANEMPDWLGGGSAKTEEEDVPDWLRKMRGEEPAPLKAESSPPPAAPSAPDWLKSAMPDFSASPAPGGDDLPDWLKASGEGRHEAQASPTWLTPERAAPDEPESSWVKQATAPLSLPGESETPTPWLAPTDDTPEWLQPKTPLAAAAPTPPAPPPSAPPPPAFAAPDDLPDWMKAGADPAAPSFGSAPNDDLPDWLRAGAEVAPAAAASASALPDWLRTGAEPTPPTGTSVAPAFDAGASDLPDWLSAGATPAPAPTPGESGAPDWFSAGAVETPAAAPSFGDVGDDTPDWMKPGPVAPAPPPVTDEVPDWMKGAARDLPDTPAPAFAAHDETPDWMKPSPDEAPPPAPSSGDDFDWLSGTTGGAAPASSAETAPDWLQPVRSAAPAKSAAPTPDWMQTLRQAPAASADSSPSALANDAAAMPGWLDAMRPTEGPSHAGAEADDHYQENVGVLAGLHGILRAEPIIAKPKKSLASVHKIDVTEAHRKQIALIEALNREAEAPTPVVKRKVRVGPVMERALVFTFVLLLLIVPLFAPGVFPLPTTVRPATLRVFTQLEAAPAAQPALIAFDYDSTQRGELDPAAQAIVAQLLRRNVPVMAVSTKLNGAGIAQAVMQTAAAQVGASFNFTYTEGFHYLNLGYIPGGPVGLAQFANAPRTVIANDFNRQYPSAYPLWETAIPISRVQSLKDFGVVVVLADSPEAVRAWVEQALPAAPQHTLIVAVSAAAEPMVRPYAEGAAPAIDGLLSGIFDATRYTLQSAPPQLATAPLATNTEQLWAMVGGGLLAAAILIVGGNFVTGVLSLARRVRGPGQKAA